MARLKDNERELLLADFHTGQYTQRELAKKYEVSTATVNKMTKGISPKHEQKVNAIVTAHAQLEGESEHEVNAVFTIVEEKKKHMKLIYDNATKLANKLSIMSDQVDQPQDLRHLVEANDKLSVTLKVNDRHAPKNDTNVAVQTNVQNNVEMTEAQMQEELIKRGIPIDLIGH